MNEEFPLKPVNGRIIVEELPFKPSKILEVLTHDLADRTEGIVVAVDPKRYGRKFDKQKGWEHNGVIFEQDCKVGDRIIFPGKYAQDDVFEVNRRRYRALDPWEVVAILDKPQPQGFENPFTGMMEPDVHPVLIR